MINPSLDELIARLVYKVFFGLVAGASCGLLPFCVGKRFERVRLGVAGFFTCLVSGGLLGLLLALPVMIIFTVVLLILGRPESKKSLPPSSEHEQLVEVARALDQDQSPKSPEPNEPAA
jgi:uncharacterized membrane protein